jgi:FixJ family two-component response regulator
MAAFEGMGIPLWAERVRTELARCAVVPRRPTELTPVERRVATLAAEGMTNRDVAAALFISTKTVEPTYPGCIASSASTHAPNLAAT